MLLSGDYEGNICKHKLHAEGYNDRVSFTPIRQSDLLRMNNL